MSQTVDSTGKLDTLVRALNLIPYFQAHPDRSLMEAAKDLGRDPASLYEEIQRLACCGVGRWPEELVDLKADWSKVSIANSQGMDRPLRLTPTEAGALLLTLESLEAVPGLADRAAVMSAARKLRDIMGDRAVAIFDSLAAEDPAEATPQELLREAIAGGHRVAFTYRSQSSDTTRRRVVDPAKIFVTGGETYLTAWEEEAGRHKNFRADRMSDIEILDESAQPHLDSLPFDEKDPFGYRMIADQADLLIHPEHTWIADYFPITLGEVAADGYVHARMPVGSKDWFIRFALGQADRLRVIGPQVLVEEVSRRAASALTAYDQGPTFDTNRTCLER
ncbi:MAG: WYL domain-containing protein [Corynebacterium sp.]|uniref:helix-turn-helix transcriptional regulator n=1 Tax=Corynebacterium sp. TaxID=1720 RepID=UPI0026DFAB02|nr:WYL domain-containing protein [Corynebacterium sp.]MDO5669695.1 WYL domain-containing protein [Corynebacterium sp.]